MSRHDLPPQVRPPAAAAVLPVVPGHRVRRLLGAGSSGRVWAATAPDGTDVAVKVLTGASAGALAAEADLFAELEHPAVVRLREVVATSQGPALVMDRAPGGSLGALVAARGALEPGEVVGVLAAVGGALADLHARGLVHGDLSPANVLLAADGRPLLADWGLATLVGLGAADADAAGAPAPAPTGHGRRSAAPPAAPPAPLPGTVAGTPGYADPSRRAGTPPTPAGDVHALAAVGWCALTGTAPPPAAERVPLGVLVPAVPPALSAVLAEALDPDPARRPDAAALAHRCAQAAPAQPVHLVPTDPAAPPEEVITHRLRAAAAAAAQEEEPRRRSRAGRGVAAGAVLLALGGAGGLAVVHALDDPTGPPRPAAAAAAPSPARSGARAPSPSAARSASPSAAPAAGEAALTGADPAAAVQALADLRARAYDTADPALLAQLDAAGSAPAAVDAAAVRRLAAAGERLEGLAFAVRSADVVDRTGNQAWVRTTVTTSAHRVVRAGGAVTEVPASAPVTSLLLLSRQDGRWVVSGSG